MVPQLPQHQCLHSLTLQNSQMALQRGQYCCIEVEFIPSDTKQLFDNLPVFLEAWGWTVLLCRFLSNVACASIDHALRSPRAAWVVLQIQPFEANNSSCSCYKIRSSHRGGHPLPWRQFDMASSRLGSQSYACSASKNRNII